MRQPTAPHSADLEALKDVAVALRYTDRDAYNMACIHRPSEVVERIAAL